MATAAAQNRDTALCLRTRSDDRHGWGLALLLTVVATLFLRPADLIPGLEGWPIYEYLIVCCLVVSARPVARQLSQYTLSRQTVTACLLLLLFFVAMSHLSHGAIWSARMSVYDVGKLLLFYVLVTGLLNTPHRLVVFSRYLTIAITMVAVLALLDRLQVISISALESVQSRGENVAGQAELIDRIRGTGIFQDPNDFGLILVTGLILTASFLLKPRAGWPRYIWLAPGAVLLVTLGMTHSRGAFVSLGAALPAALAYRRGWKVGALSLLLLPLLAVVFSDRMTDITAVNEGTGQSRIQIWSDTLTLFQQYPVFGAGKGILVEEINVVSHNSFLQCYAELGFFGGTTFIACFMAAALGLWTARSEKASPIKPDQASHELHDMAHLRAFIFTALVAYSVGMLTLSRQFVVPTYLILGMAVAARPQHSDSPQKWQTGMNFLPITMLAGVAFLLMSHLFVKFFVAW